MPLISGLKIKGPEKGSRFPAIIYDHQDVLDPITVSGIPNFINLSN